MVWAFFQAKAAPPAIAPPVAAAGPPDPPPPSAPPPPVPDADEDFPDVVGRRGARGAGHRRYNWGPWQVAEVRTTAGVRIGHL